MKRTGALSAVALLVLVATASSSSSMAATAPGGETLTLAPDCSTYPPWHGVTMSLTGFAPHETVQGEIGLPGGGAAGFGPVATDDSGSYSAFTSTDRSGIFSADAYWSGGHLAESLYIDCAQSGPPPPTGNETLILRPDCTQYPPSHILRINLAGFRPHTRVTGSVDEPGGGHFGPVTVETDGNGRYSASLGSSIAGRWTVRVQWSGRKLAKSLSLDCARPGGVVEVRPSRLLRFGAHPVGVYGEPLQVTVTNFGPKILHFRSARITGGAEQEFIVASDSCSHFSIAVGRSCFVRLRFGPAADGLRSARLELTSSSAPRGYDLALRGAGLPNGRRGAKPAISGSVRPLVTRAGDERCFEFRARALGRPLVDAEVRFAGMQAQTGSDGSATICAFFRYRGTRTARILKPGYRSVLLRIRVRP